MRSYFDTHQIDVFDATPLQMGLLLESSGETGLLPFALIGGDSIGHSLWRRISQHYDGRSQCAFNVYGPTEATVDATAAEISGERPTIGRPLANVHCHVLDESAQPQPVGVLGELYISGRNVIARGYAGSASLTAERFVDIDVAGSLQKAYRTGDIVRWTAEGNLEFLGRADAQVKIRGYRVELTEIEYQLCQIEGVVSATVVAREGADSLLELVGYAVPAVETEAQAGAEWSNELRQKLRRVLPEYMVPIHIVTMTALPMTSNGKLDRNALPEPEARAASMRARRLPDRAIEHVVAGIWEERLKRPAIGIDENFFELGGNSILAARVVSRIATIFQVRIPLRSFFENPSVEGVVQVLAGLADASMLNDVAEVYLSIANLDESEVSALLAAQEDA